MTTKTIVTRGTTRPKLGQKPLYSDMTPSFLEDLRKQSTIPEYLEMRTRTAEQSEIGEPSNHADVIYERELRQSKIVLIKEG